MDAPPASLAPCETHPQFLCQFWCPYLRPFFLGEETPIGRASCEVRLTNGIEAFVAAVNRHDREAAGRLDEITAAVKARAWLEHMARYGVLARTDPEVIRRRLAKYVRSRAVAPRMVPLQATRVEGPRDERTGVSEPLESLVKKLLRQWNALLLTWPSLAAAQYERYREAFRQAVTYVHARQTDDIPPFVDILKAFLESQGAGPEELTLVETLYEEFRRRYSPWRRRS